MIALRWLIRGVGVISTFILARLLAPHDFGLVAMAMTVISLVSFLNYAGQKMALVRHHNPTREHFDSVWTLSIMLAFGITLILWAVAGPAELYFHEPRVTWLIRILALSVLIGGFENVGLVNFDRDLRFDRIFVYRFVQRVITTVVTIGAAIWLGDWRALVIGALAGRAIGVALSYAMHPYRPRLCVTKIREVLSFSGWMLAIGLSQYASDNSDQWAVGSLGSPTAMGAYTVAFDAATAPTSETVVPATQALFPVFARIRDDAAALRSGYLNVLSVTCVLSIAFGGGVALVAEDFVRVCLGAQWMMAVPLVRALGIAGGLYTMMHNGIPVLTATGNERLAARLTATRGVATILGVGGAALFGDVLMIAYARVLITLLYLPSVFAVVTRVLPVTWGDLVGRLWRPLSAGIAMAGAVLTVHAMAPDVPTIRLAIDVATGAVTYTVVLLGLWAVAGFPGGLEASAVSWLSSVRLPRRRRAGS